MLRSPSEPFRGFPPFHHYFTKMPGRVLSQREARLQYYLLWIENGLDFVPSRSRTILSRFGWSMMLGNFPHYKVNIKLEKLPYDFSE